MLIIGEVSVKKETKWDPTNQQFVGTVDYGNIKAESPDNIAKNILLIMTASLKTSFYIPLA